MLAIAIESGRGKADDEQDGDGERDPLQTNGGFLGKRSTANRYALLGTQEWRFLFGFEIKNSGVVEGFAAGAVTLGGVAYTSLFITRPGKRVQLFLDGSGTGFPRHAFGLVVDRKPLSKITIAVFRKTRQCKVDAVNQ